MVCVLSWRLALRRSEGESGGEGKEGGGGGGGGKEGEGEMGIDV